MPCRSPTGAGGLWPRATARRATSKRDLLGEAYPAERETRRWTDSRLERPDAVWHCSFMPKAAKKTFKRGDHVSWNSEAGRVRGRILRVHTKDVDYKGYVHHASSDDPQYEIKSDKTDHVALHKGRALRLLKS